MAAFAFSTLASWVHAADAADNPSTDVPRPSSDNSKTKQEKDEPLQEVVVTGSLIPQSKVETFTPILTITNEDIQARGFADVAEALQRASFSTGSVLNAPVRQWLHARRQGHELLRLGPVLYQVLDQTACQSPTIRRFTTERNRSSASRAFRRCSSIISISSPARSPSIYGSDAIAGVVNVVMKQKMDGPMIDVRYGFTDGGGGADRRIAIGDGFSIGRLNVVAGAQYDSTSPIWGYQRSLTSQYYTPRARRRNTLTRIT